MTPDEIIAALREKAEHHREGDHRQLFIITSADAIHYENIQAAIYDVGVSIAEILVHLHNDMEAARK